MCAWLVSSYKAQTPSLLVLNLPVVYLPRKKKNLRLSLSQTLSKSDLHSDTTLVQYISKRVSKAVRPVLALITKADSEL